MNGTFTTTLNMTTEVALIFDKQPGKRTEEEHEEETVLSTALVYFCKTVTQSNGRHPATIFTSKSTKMYKRELNAIRRRKRRSGRESINLKLKTETRYLYLIKGR